MLCILFKLRTSTHFRGNAVSHAGENSDGRLTYAFSKKWNNLKVALALHFAYCNFCRVHKTLRVAPAMEAGIADHVWELAELIAV